MSARFCKPGTPPVLVRFNQGFCCRGAYCTMPHDAAAHDSQACWLGALQVASELVAHGFISASDGNSVRAQLGSVFAAQVRAILQSSPTGDGDAVGAQGEAQPGAQ